MHAPKTKMDLQSELIQMEGMRDDVRRGLWDTVQTKSGDVAADGMTKAVGGKAFVRFVQFNTGLMKWRPIDRLRHQLKAKRCGRVGCDSRWLVHEYDPKRGCMVATCQQCRHVTPT